MKQSAAASGTGGSEPAYESSARCAGQVRQGNWGIVGKVCGWWRVNAPEDLACIPRRLEPIPKNLGPGHPDASSLDAPARVDTWLHEIAPVALLVPVLALVAGCEKIRRSRMPAASPDRTALMRSMSAWCLPGMTADRSRTLGQAAGPPEDQPRARSGIYYNGSASGG